MLDLLRTFTACPTTGLQHLALPRETLLLYPSSDSVVILNSHTLAFIRALAFWEAFPGALHASETINRVSVDPGMKLIVASMGSRLATWAMSGVQSDTWRVHSSLVLPEAQKITAVDCKSGLLAIGTLSSLSVYTLLLENDLPTWSLKWTLPISHLSRVRFSPSLMYMASTSSSDNSVRIYLTTSGKQTQVVPHPRPITDVNWRMAQASSRDDSVLYTVTSDATLRVFLPVIDTPQYVQLHASLDVHSALPFSLAQQVRQSSIFWLDRQVISNALTTILKQTSSNHDDIRAKRVQEITEEGWDLFIRVLSDCSLVVQAVANIDRRPPTLLKAFTLLQSPPQALESYPLHLYVLPNPAQPGTLTLVTSPPITSYTLDPLLFLDVRSDGLMHTASCDELPLNDEPEVGVEERMIVRFERTPDGEGVGVIRMDGAGETWAVSPDGRNLTSRRKCKLDAGFSVDLLVVLQQGKSEYFVTYSAGNDTLMFHADPPVQLTVSKLISLFSIPNSTPSSLPSCHVSLVGVTADQEIVVFDLTLPTTVLPGTLSISSTSALPLPSPPLRIMPVDPMAWSNHYLNRYQEVEHDALLSISGEGELAFWIPLGSNEGPSWKCTGAVRTGRVRLTKARCSSAKKSALVVATDNGEELTIWDSKESEFASGLEYRQILSYPDSIHDLDWTATPDGQSILAVGFTRRVEVYSQQRMTYFDDVPAWGLCWKLDLEKMLPHPISDAIWLNRGSLLVGAGHFMTLFGQTNSGMQPDAPESLFEYVARHNGPLSDYHPQLILQCLLWEKVEVVKSIIVNLARNIERTRNVHDWQPIPVEDFLQQDELVKASPSRLIPVRISMDVAAYIAHRPEETEFSPILVKQLIERLEQEPIPHLTPNEHQSLLVLIQTALEIEEHRRALDSNGLRYLITMRVFHNLNRRLSQPNSPPSNGSQSHNMQKRERLRYRDMIWAFHSESQELLLSASVATCEGGKMSWADAKALGVFIWLRSHETMKAHMELIARSQFLAGDNRDPTQCSLFYFALGKVKLVHGLWRQASWHKEYNVMLKFLNNDFTQPRWRTAASKNAFALLSKRRFEYAAAFFLLGGSLKDAVNVCIKNLQDFQLAVAITRVVEQGDEGPVLAEILNNTVLPVAFKEGNRYLASWAFWLLRRRDLAVRILVTPLQDIARTLTVQVTEIGEPHYDDPSLALLFAQLKSKTLQTAKGTSEISGRTEFNFVLQMARVFCRMGCHVLALDIVRSWSFERPSVVVRDTRYRPPSPLTTRFALEPALRRRASILIDMDIKSDPPTRPASPVHAPPNGVGISASSAIEDKVANEGDLIARKAGIGSLMKSAKQDVSVPEFDMNAFF
ncbi:hypothetical protein K474DRAFT_1742410 [Panus rudis PR-1116 ss-1]|nr:hypothetical protein K474DRAFT_1742410 [Panus rudis PR-1116 ss-1]